MDWRSRSAILRKGCESCRWVVEGDGAGNLGLDGEAALETNHQKKKFEGKDF